MSLNLIYPNLSTAHILTEFVQCCTIFIYFPAMGIDYFESTYDALLHLTVHFERFGDGPVMAGFPTMVHVDAITVDLARKIADEAHELWSESLWTRFAQTALTFPNLRQIKLQKYWGLRNPGKFRRPAFLGITDAAFKPLMDAQKFECLCRHSWDVWEVGHTSTCTVGSKSECRRYQRAHKARNGDGDRDGDDRDDSDSESEEADNNGEMNIGERPICFRQW